MRRPLAFLVPLLVLAPGAGPAVAAQTTGFVTCTDFITGTLSAVNLDTRAVTIDAASTGSDAAPRWFAGRPQIVNRFGGDNIQVIDPGQGWLTALQYSTGNGSNPQDICFVSPTRAYVSRYERTGLWIVNPETGAFLGEISLAAFADADGIPEMARMVRVDRYVFVAIQRVDRNGGFQPTDSSLVAVIDSQTDTVVDTDPALPGTQAILLPATNPVTGFAFDRATTRLLVGCAGRLGVLDGGIAAIDPVRLRSLGLTISEAALGGDIGDVEWNGPAHSYAIVTDAAYNTTLVAWSDVSHSVIGPVYAPGGYSLTDCALNDRGELYVCNSGVAAPGLYVFGTANDALLAGPLDTGLPPNQICFDATTEVLAAPLPTARLAFSVARPNPARERASFTLALPEPGEVDVAVFDVTGRRITTLAHGPLPAGPTALTWNLRDAAGTRVPAGVYLVRARAAGGKTLRRVVVAP